MPDNKVPTGTGKPKGRKSKPSFVIPANIPTASQTGWVYRSDAPLKEENTIAAVRPVIESRSPADPLRPLWMPVALLCSFVLAMMSGTRLRPHSVCPQPDELRQGRK